MKTKVQYPKVENPGYTYACTGSAEKLTILSKVPESSTKATGRASCRVSEVTPRLHQLRFGAAAFAPELRLPPSTRIEATAANRALLRYLRHAEMEAWEDAARSHENLAVQDEPPYELPRVVAAARGSRTERWLYALLTIPSLAGVGWAVLNSAEMLNRWPGFVRFIQQLVS